VRAAAVLLGGLVVLVAGTACGERKEPTGAQIRIYPVTVQGAGDQPTTLRTAPRRIVPLGAGPRRILHALGLKKRTVPVNGELVGLPLVGRIRRAKPDLVIASEDADPLDLARARAATHAAVYVEPGESLDDVEHGIDDIGLLTGRPVAARRLSAAISRTRRRVAARLSGYPVVSVFVDLGGFSTVGTRSLLGDLVVAARGQNIAGTAPEQGPFPLRQLLKRNPDVYITTSDSGTTLAGLRANPQTRRLRAIRQKRFGVIKDGLVEPGPDLGTALGLVARILHPNAFT
jgi:iron complex transport system substrate-binding protein